MATGGSVQMDGVTGDGALPRLRFRVPDRSDLPALDRYASLQMPSGDRKVVGYTEATRWSKTPEGMGRGSL